MVETAASATITGTKPVTAKNNGDYKGFIAGVFSGMAKLTGMDNSTIFVFLLALESHGLMSIWWNLALLTYIT